MEPQESTTSVRQLSFGFADNGSDGLTLWREHKRELVRRLGLELGLPVGSSCEVVLASGIQLRGRLVLEEEMLFPLAARKDAKLRIGEVTFSITEIAVCVRLE